VFGKFRSRPIDASQRRRQSLPQYSEATSDLLMGAHLDRLHKQVCGSEEVKSETGRLVSTAAKREAFCSAPPACSGDMHFI